MPRVPKRGGCWATTTKHSPLRTIDSGQSATRRRRQRSRSSAGSSSVDGAGSARTSAGIGRLDPSSASMPATIEGPAPNVTVASALRPPQPRLVALALPMMTLTDALVRKAKSLAWRLTGCCSASSAFFSVEAGAETDRPASATGSAMSGSSSGGASASNRMGFSISLAAIGKLRTAGTVVRSTRSVIASPQLAMVLTNFGHRKGLTTTIRSTPPVGNGLAGRS